MLFLHPQGYVVVSELINYTGTGEVNQSLVLLNSDPLGAHQLSYQPLDLIHEMVMKRECG